MKTNSHILLALGRCLIMLLIFGGLAVASSATSGDGRGKAKPKKLLSTKTYTTPGAFSLRSGYRFRGQQVMNFESSTYINLNTVVNYQQGHTTYTIPLKKKVILNNKVTFNPNAASR